MTQTWKITCDGPGCRAPHLADSKPKHPMLHHCLREYWTLTFPDGHVHHFCSSNCLSVYVREHDEGQKCLDLARATVRQLQHQLGEVKNDHDRLLAKIARYEAMAIEAEAETAACEEQRSLERSTMHDHTHHHPEGDGSTALYHNHSHAKPHHEEES